MIPKQNNLISNAIRKSAKGEDCTLNIAGVCNNDTETVVLCHFPSDWSGRGIKSPDFVAGYGCHACHQALDGHNLSSEERDFYMRRSTYRTHRMLIGKGLMIFKGAK